MLSGSKTNQRGDPTLRVLNRSGHHAVCPVFGAMCLLKARRSLPVNSIPELVRKTRVRIQRNGVEHNPAGGCPFWLRSEGFQRTLLESRRGHTHVSSRGRHAVNPVSRTMGIGHVQAVHAPVQGIRVIARVKDRQRLEAHEQPSVKHTASSHQGGSTHPTGITLRTPPRPSLNIQSMCPPYPLDPGSGTVFELQL
jgi:hypothetical protein